MTLFVAIRVQQTVISVYYTESVSGAFIVVGEIDCPSFRMSRQTSQIYVQRLMGSREK